ncbi:MAG: orotidine-5'-phosphate decarboxylase [Bacteroidota bacterium]
MNREQLINTIRKKKSFLCVGLDSDILKIPKHLLEKEDPIFEFNKAIIDATHKYCVAYKPNFAFYESMGSLGWQSLEKTVAYIRENVRDVFLIADAKRGDIGNTSKLYARAVFEKDKLDFDAITVAPYMGSDSVQPFLDYPNKWVIILALTSNQGASDFQLLQTENKHCLYEDVLTKTRDWGNEGNIMYVVGATKASMLNSVRNIVPNHFLLVPGVGAQGGSLSEVAKFGMTKECGLIVNSSRDILYAGKAEDFAVKAAEETQSLQEVMESLLREYEVI